jgi:hypothetical protein
MSPFWTNRSVLVLAGKEDPEAKIVDRAREVVFEAMEQGWDGPPFDPFALADLRGIPVVAREDLYDARVVPIGRGGGVRIEYNPNRPLARQRYSVAHELAHTLFADVAEIPRYRSGSVEATGDEWQLELLCNLAAAELLMPVGAFPELKQESLNVEHVLQLRQDFGVSTEVMLLRIAKLSSETIGVFAASRTDGNRVDAPLRVDYVHGSRAWRPRIAKGTKLPRTTMLSAITAIGYTAQGDEVWPTGLDHVHVEGVGLPPYPGQRVPRIAGVIRPREAKAGPVAPGLSYVRGDATQPRGDGPRFILQVVNDKTPNWGGAFAQALRRRYPEAQEGFRDWARPGGLVLGTTCIDQVADGLWVASMVAQHGYGAARKPRIRYTALQRCLRDVATHAIAVAATAHMPRVGAGQAGGRWDVIEELIDSELAQRGVAATVYSLPGEQWDVQPRQTTLSLS